MPTPPLSRTSSASSVASDDTALSIDDNTVVPDTPSTGQTSDGGSSVKPRKRKRFTNAQLVALEQVFHQTSHPTREQRVAVAKETGLELRSATIWFQNKRQTERKIALCYGPNFGKETDCAHAPEPFPTAPVLTINRATPLSTNASYQRSIRHSTHGHRSQLSPARHPSLDSIASRHERPQPRSKTPTRARTYSSPNLNNIGSSTAALWENMPSSPLTSSSPERERRREREFVDFGKRGRTRMTLEWACAAARLSGRTDDDDEDQTSVLKSQASFTQSRHTGFIVQTGHPELETLDFGGDTEEESEAHEAVTPSSSHSRVSVDAKAAGVSCLGRGQLEKGHRREKAKRPEVKVQGLTHDEEMVNAALVLCGLGKR